MIKRLLFAITAIALIAVVYLFQTSDQQPTEKLLFSDTSYPQDDIIRKDGPAQFAAAQAMIRTQIGQDKPAYKMGYRMHELNKAMSQNRSAPVELDWVERGPANVGGRTRGVIVDPDDETAKTWFVGSAGGGVWKTEDGGGSWENLTGDFGSLAASTLAMSKSNTNKIYVGTGEGFPNIDGIIGSGMYVSEDKGESWTTLGTTSTDDKFANVLRIIVDPKDENSLVVCTSDEGGGSFILKSTDGGLNWVQALGSSQAVQQLVFHESDFTIQYAAINSRGVFQSTDAGATWDEVFSISPDFSEVRRIEMAIAPTNPNVIYLSCEDGSGSRLIVTQDAFATYKSAIYQEVEADWLRNQGWYDNTIAVHPYHDSLVWVAGQGTMLEIDISTIQDTFRTFDDLENNTDFALPITSSLISDDPFGLSSELFMDFPLPIGTETTRDDLVEVEIRFGDSISSLAHLIKVDIFSYAFNFGGMVEVPFEAWDVENDVQLAVTVFDIDDDDKWSLIDFQDEDVFNDIVNVHTHAYADTANPIITENPINKALYYFFVGQNPDFEGSFDTLPEGNLRLTIREETGFVSDFRPVADGYGQYRDIEDVGSKGVHVDHHNIVLIPRDITLETFYVLNANDGGLAFSEDQGETFLQTGSSFDIGQPTSLGYNVSQFYGIDKRNGVDQFVGGTQDNGSWTSDPDPDETSIWKEAPSGDGFECAWNYDDGMQVIESSQRNNIYKSRDGGNSWSRVTLPESSGPFITRVASSQINADLLLMSSSEGVLRSLDFGDSWEVVNMPSRWSYQSSWGPPIEISLADGETVYTGSRMDDNSGMVASLNGGKSFFQTTNYSLADRGSITGFGSHPSQPKTVYVLFSQADGPKILRSTNRGNSWKDISGFVTNRDESTNGFPDVAVYDLLVMPWEESTIWAATEIGIFETNDSGGSWHFADNGLPPVSIWQMKIVNDQLVVATHGRGVFTLNTSELISTSTKNLDKPILDAAIYPNPMVDQTTLTYQLDKASDVNIAMYSLDGKMVQQVLSTRQSAGSHNVDISRDNLTSGIYFVKLNTPGQVISKQVVVE